jgi:hypothetical protein
MFLQIMWSQRNETVFLARNDGHRVTIFSAPVIRKWTLNKIFLLFYSHRLIIAVFNFELNVFKNHRRITKNITTKLIPMAHHMTEFSTSGSVYTKKLLLLRH